MTKYQQGRKYEYKVMEEYRAKGYYVMRSSGSHGLFDVIAINIDTKDIKLIQCKKGKISKNQKTLLLESLMPFEGCYYVYPELKIKDEVSELPS